MYDRINKLKEYAIYNDFGDYVVTIDDLYLKDENGQTFLDYIIENKIGIYDKKLISYISNDYNILLNMINKNCFVNWYYSNLDLLFDESKGKFLVELIFEKGMLFYVLSLDGIYRLFQNNSGKYMIEKLLKIDEGRCISMINRINNLEVLYNCFSKINRLDLLRYSNENCLLSKTPKGITALEMLINMGVSVNVSKMDYRVTSILYDKGKYNDLLTMDADILINYPDKENNYLLLLINNYKKSKSNLVTSLISRFKKEVIDFNNIILNSSNSKSLAMANIILLRNGIVPDLDFLILSSSCKPFIIYMLEMDMDLVLKNYDNELLIYRLKEYLSGTYGISDEELKNFKISDVFNYLPKTKDAIREITHNNMKIKANGKDIYRDDLLEVMDNGLTILEYALKNKLIDGFYDLNNVKEAMIFLKFCDKDAWFSFDEKLLYEDIGDGQLLIDYLIKNQYFHIINNSYKRDLRIIDYCIKYNRFDIIPSGVLDELFVQCNDSFLAEKYLNNELFLKKMGNYDLSDEKMLALYKKGYKKIMTYAKENLLLTKYDNVTILEDMLRSGILPEFGKFGIKQLDTLKILYDLKKPELMCYASLELLMNYPSKDNNYLKYMIDSLSYSVHIDFNKIRCSTDDKELLARYYIQMAKEHILNLKYIEQLEIFDLVSIGKDGNNLLRYLFELDKDTTINILLRPLKQKNMKKLKYDKFDYIERCCTALNDAYCKDVDSTSVEPLLNRFKELFYNDGKSDKELIDALMDSYRYSISTDDMFSLELENLIKIKEENPDFCYIKESCRAYFSRAEDKVVSEYPIISTVIHETGHAMHYYLTKYGIPEGYENVIKKIAENPEFMLKLDELSKTFEVVVGRINFELFKTNTELKVSENEKVNIMNFLNKSKEEKMKEYLERGYSKETLEMLDDVFSASFSYEDFIIEKEILLQNEIRHLFYRYDYDGYTAVSDIVDAITGGKFHDGLLTNDKGDWMQSIGGHGGEYYSDGTNLQNMFTEMVANYAVIIKSKKREEYLKVLRKVVGNELVCMLDEFYTSKIIGMPLNNVKVR